MKTRTIRAGDTVIAVVDSGEVRITGGQSALNLMMTCAAKPDARPSCSARRRLCRRSSI